MEYVYGTAVINGVTRENLKIVGGPELAEGEYLTTVREYDDSTITDRCRIGALYHSDTDEAGVRYDFYAISEHYRYVDKSKAMEETKQVTEIAFVALAETGGIDAVTAGEHKTMFDEWRAGVNYTVGQYRNYGDKLYRCVQAHTSQEGWEPDAAASLWAVVDATHAGTADDPIPAARGMEYEYGKYYLDGEDGKTYLCARTGEPTGGTVTLQYLPHELVGNYFEEVAA